MAALVMAAAFFTCASATISSRIDEMGVPVSWKLRQARSV
jgi:hypothetical protein